MDWEQRCDKAFAIGGGVVGVRGFMMVVYLSADATSRLTLQLTLADEDATHANPWHSWIVSGVLFVFFNLLGLTIVVLPILLLSYRLWTRHPAAEQSPVFQCVRAARFRGSAADEGMASLERRNEPDGLESVADSEFQRKSPAVPPRERQQCASRSFAHLPQMAHQRTLGSLVTTQPPPSYAEAVAC